jgi:2-dehydropantoate 2-reductase
VSAAAKICVYGAGSIGCYVGGRLKATGTDVAFVGRPRLAQEVTHHGLHLTDFHGADLHVAGDHLPFFTNPTGASAADLVLVTVKSAGTAEAGRELAQVLPSRALVLSLQNGMGNAEVLRKELPNHTVLEGMVPFNVVNRGNGEFHQGSEGDLAAADHEGLRLYLPMFERAGLPLKLHPQIHSVQWAKLLLNLNNPVNALSDLPLKEQLAQRDYRRCVAITQREAIDLLNAAGVKLARLTPLPPHWIPAMLSLPDWIFRRVANQMLEIDPLARSSMWEDLQAGRTTEVDWLNGEILRLAQKLGRAAPANARMIELVREAESGGQRQWTAAKLLAELERSLRGREKQAS